MEKKNPINDFLDEQKKRSKFLTIKDGESVRMIINSYKKATGYQGKDTIAFQVDVYYSDGMKSKTFDCVNQSFLNAVVNLPKQGIGQEIEVSRAGKQTDTKYFVKLAREEEPKEE